MKPITLGNLIFAQTDYRMKAKRYNFDYQVITSHYDTFTNLREVSEQVFGTGWAWFNKRRVIYPYGKFGSQYDFSNRYDAIKHRLYFRTREDAETVLTLYTLKHGITE